MSRKKKPTGITRIKKRDGRLVRFSPKKIERAMGGAFKAAGEYDEKVVRELTKKIVMEMEKRFNRTIIPEVEQAQDLIEKTLMKEGYEKVHKSFKLYRELHRKLRDIDSLVDSDELIENYLTRSDWRVKENANMTYSLQGLNNHVASVISSNYWLNRFYSRETRKAHVSGDLHIHDLALLSPYCAGWDLRDLLMKGFGGVSGKISSKPPKHLGSALGQLVNFFYTIQGEVAGAVAVANFDTYLAPFIRHDKLSYEELKQKIQEFVFNMNVPTRVGFQTPFTNVTMDLKPTGIVADEAVIIGGKPWKGTYKDYQKEIDLFNKAFAEVMAEGDAQGRVFTFPIPTYSLTKDFDWDNEVLEPVWEMTRKYGIPYFSNYINSDMSPDDARSMCCRLRLDNRELRKRGGLFAANPLTGSIGVVTINLPRLGYVSRKESKSEGMAKRKFMSKLGKLMDLAKDSLTVKREAVEDFTEKGLYPYCRYYLEDLHKKNGEYWKNHFNTIGLNGMNEALINLLGKDMTNGETKEFVLEVMDYMREKLLIYQKETGEMFNLEATPAEGTAYRFARLDKKLYPKIVCANEEEYQKEAAPFYTNSTQLPVDYTSDLFEAFDHQDEIQCKYTGGTVLHAFLGESMPSVKSVKNLVKKLAKTYKMPYFSLTPTFSICSKHGYIKGEHEYCPKCDEESGYNKAKEAEKKKIERTHCEIYSRIVGYLRPVSQWNDGKTEEFKKRKVFKAS